MRRIQVFLLIIGLAICIVSCKKEETVMSLEPTKEQEGASKEKGLESICVYVCGAVQNEGVYELPEGSRVYEAVEKAGGLREDAARAEVNMAQVLEDAMQIYIPTIVEIQNSQSKNGGKINLNRATKEELMTLPGVGEAKAESIIRYRKNKGAFSSIDEIMQISGIKETLYEKIKDLITI